MTTLSRVKERIETDLGDTELQAMIDEITAEIEAKFGVNGSITIHLGGDRELAGDRRYISLTRPYSSDITITEIDGTTETALSSDDYRIIHGGRTIERLTDGTNARSFWERLVKVAYTPVSDAEQRVEATILLTQLGIEYRGLKSEKAGDYSASMADYAEERDKIMGRLAPRRGLAMA